MIQIDADEEGKINIQHCSIPDLTCTCTCFVHRLWQITQTSASLLSVVGFIINIVIILVALPLVHRISGSF